MCVYMNVCASVCNSVHAREYIYVCVCDTCVYYVCMCACNTCVLCITCVCVHVILVCCVLRVYVCM